MLRIILQLFLVTLVYCQTNFQTWTAQTIVTSPQMGSGYFVATVKYDWPAGMMEVAFQDLDYKEFYVFNKDKGYNSKVATGQFTYQYMYKTSSKCPCEIVGLQKAMPAWFPGAVSPAVEPNYNIQYWPDMVANDNGLVSLTGASKSATLYAANTNFKATLPDGTVKSFIISNSLWLNTDATKSVAGFQLTDPNNQLRTFTITSLTQANTGTLGLVAPSSSACPCRKLVDIVLSLDRSGSISYDQWLLEYQFVQNLANSFEYGADGANFGIGNWNSQQWQTIGLSAGTSKTSVISAVNAMKCCDTAATGDASCCCCGTPIGGGIYLGGKMLMEGRPRATKVLIVLTDGCQNHLWVDQPTPQAIQCGCASEQLCAANKTCTGDITKWYQIVTTQYVPGTKVIAIGVGGSNTVCRDQLVMAAGNDETNVYNPDSWQALQTIVQTISATACTITATPCEGCCGICTCGQCIPAPRCFNPDKCTIGAVDNTTKCCTTYPVECTPKACNNVNCDPATGCGYVPLTCKANETCSYWYCNEQSQVCTQALKPDNELPAECDTTDVIDECTLPSDCGAADPCKTIECFKLDDKTPATCKITQKTCPPSDNCTSRVCRPGVGCVESTKTCNDYSLCTTDKCEPTVQGGCVFTPIGDCPQPTDACKKAICHKDKGCIEVPVNCSERGYVVSIENCTIPACNKTCFNQYICAPPPPPNGVEEFPTTVVLISALSTAAIIGIVVAAAVLVVGLGGAAGVAIAGAAGAGGVALVAQNPIYAPSGASGTNTLFKDQS